MSKRPKMSAMLGAAAEDVAPVSRDNVVTSPRDPVETGSPDPVASASRGPAPKGYKERTRYEKPHYSFYATPEVMRALKEMAFRRDVKVHDLFVDGMRHVFERDGLDFDRLNRKKD